MFTFRPQHRVLEERKGDSVAMHASSLLPSGARTRTRLKHSRGKKEKRTGERETLKSRWTLSLSFVYGVGPYAALCNSSPSHPHSRPFSPPRAPPSAFYLAYRADYTRPTQQRSKEKRGTCESPE